MFLRNNKRNAFAVFSMVFVLLFFSSIVLNTITELQLMKLENANLEVRKLYNLFSFELISALEENLLNNDTKKIRPFSERIEINDNIIYFKEGKIILQKGEK